MLRSPRPALQRQQQRVEHRAEVDALVAAEFARHSRNELAERLKSAEIAFGNFNTVEDFSHHPHLRRIAVETPEGPVRLPPAPPIFEEERPAGRVPALGEHTAAVRADPLPRARSASLIRISLFKRHAHSPSRPEVLQNG